MFDGDRYFDVFVEYAKGEPDDLLIRISAVNRGSEPAALHVLPTLWYRNTWSSGGGGSKPELARAADWDGASVVRAQHTDALFLESLPSTYYQFFAGQPAVVSRLKEVSSKEIE